MFSPLTNEEYGLSNRRGFVVAYRVAQWHSVFSMVLYSISAYYPVRHPVICSLLRAVGRLPRPRKETRELPWRFPYLYPTPSGIFTVPLRAKTVVCRCWHHVLNEGLLHATAWLFDHGPTRRFLESRKAICAYPIVVVRKVIVRSSCVSFTQGAGW